VNRMNQVAVQSRFTNQRRSLDFFHVQGPFFVAERRVPKARPISDWGNAPGRDTKSNTKRQQGVNSAAQFQNSRMLVPHPASKPFTRATIANRMKRAFSALASAGRVLSPLGWAGMKGAFGAPGYAGAAAPAQATKPEILKLQNRFSNQRSKAAGRNPSGEPPG